jgi:uracil phosphoribosyltransferase
MGVTDSCKPGPLSPRISLLPQGNHLLSLMTILRDSNTTVATFADVTERVGDQLISAGM